MESLRKLQVTRMLHQAVTFFSLAAIFLLSAAAGEPALAGELLPVPRPVLDSFEPPDREALEAVRVELDALLAAEGADEIALAEAFGELGSRYLLFDLVAAAEPALLNACNLQAHHPAWHYYLAVLYDREGRHEEARARLERVLELEPRDFPALVRLGRTLLDLEELDLAEERFRAALALVGEDDPAAAAALAGLGRVANERDDPKVAIERLERALELQPQATILHHQLGLAHRAAGDLERAREHLLQNRQGEVAMPDPRMDRLKLLIQGADVHLKRGNLALEAGRLEDAVREYRTALELDPDDPLVRYNLGFALVRQGDREEAKTLFRQAIELDPDYRNAHYNLAVALAEEGAWREAAKHFAEACRIDPLDHGARLEWATALLQAGEPERALEELERTLAAVDSQNSAFEGRVRLDLGALRERTGDREAALAHFEEAARLAADRPEVHAALAGALARAGRFADAAAAFQAAVELDPQDVGLRFGQAMALLLAGDDRAAAQRLEEGVAALPESLPLAHLLARVLSASEDADVRAGDRAVALARRVLEADATLDNAETLAMALAETGRFEEAAAVQRQVAERAEAAGDEVVAERARRRLALYQAGTPVRAPWRSP